MKKQIKIITILIISIIILSIIPNIAMATETHTAGEIIEGGKDFIQVGIDNKGNEKITSDSLKNLSNTIYNILLVVGIVVAIIVGLIMGIKFILGGIEEKAEIKTMVIPYIIGCIIVFGAFAIWQIVVNILQSI